MSSAIEDFRDYDRAVKESSPLMLDALKRAMGDRKNDKDCLLFVRELRRVLRKEAEPELQLALNRLVELGWTGE